MAIRITLPACAAVCLMAWIDVQATVFFLIAAAVHELGHLVLLHLCSVEIYGIRICASGAVIDAPIPDYKQEIFCAMAGPVAGILLCVTVVRQLPELALISLALSVVNFLPLCPMDGGRILRAALLLLVDPVSAEKAMSVINFLTCGCLMVLACWGTICLQAGVWPIFAALAVLSGVGNMENSCFSRLGRIK